MAANPAYLNICASMRGFNIRTKKPRVGKPHPGMVVPSQDVIYFIVDPRLKVAGAAAVGGAAGHLIGGLVNKARGKNDGQLLPVAVPGVEQLDVASLPKEVVTHPDWPFKRKEGPVLVVPKSAVKSLRTSFWLGGIEVNLAGVSIVVFTPIFKRKQMAAAMIKLGWKVAGLKESRQAQASSPLPPRLE